MAGVTAQMGSGLTAEQRSVCIAELRTVHRRDVGQCRNGLLGFVWWPFMNYLSWTLAVSEPLGSTAVLYALWFLVEYCCFALLAWAIFRWIGALMRRHAAQVLAQTSLVADVLSLPSDELAFRGRRVMWLAAEWRKLILEVHKLCRRVTALYARFGAWSMHYGCAPEPCAVRLPIWTTFCLAGGYLYFYYYWFLGQPYVQQLVHSGGMGRPPLPHYFLASFGVLALWRAVLEGRRAGLRQALIGYFAAETAPAPGSKG